MQAIISATCHLLPLLLLSPIVSSVVGAAEDPPSLPLPVPDLGERACYDSSTGDQVADLLSLLDDNRYEARREAVRQLEAMVARPALGPLLAATFERMLVSEDVSFEVRWHLKRWRKRLPEVPIEPIDNVSAEELDRLIERMDADSYAVRQATADRLRWLLRNPKLVGSIMVRLKDRIDRSGQSEAAVSQWSSLWKEARGAWLVDDSISVDLPPVTDTQILRWIDDLSREPPVSDRSGSWSIHTTAERELLDLLARDDYLVRVKEMIGARLAEGTEQDAAAMDRLRGVLRWTRPAMVAEYWEYGNHEGEQHLIIGVPSQGKNADRASYFDRIDDEVAHCVSGQNLTPGDYPVGVAIPHPNRRAIFHLVNLPTPRRQLAYEYYVTLDEAQRLRAISRRTLGRFLDRKRLLNDRELDMLAQLDAGEVSRFAGKYFHLVSDLRPQSPQSPSHFGWIALQLAAYGTKEAMPEMLRAIDESAFLPPTSQCPYRFHWIAALSIARRDPWNATDTAPDCEAWLARLVRQECPLQDDRPQGPELGATAAALLLERHGRDPLQNGLRRAIDPQLARVGVNGFRFESAEAREQVGRWTQALVQQPPSP